MIHKKEYTEWIDSYLVNDLTPEQKLEFENEIKSNAILADEFELHSEIQDALSEKDILELKETLNTIVSPDNSQHNINNSFSLLEDIDGFNESEIKIDPNDLLNYYESLPKLHIYQHEIASKESVHHFYKEQELSKASQKEEIADTDEALMAEIEEAVMEKDVLQLRDNLKQIEKSVPEHNYSQIEIDKYLENSLDDYEVKEFEMEMKSNSQLAADVELHKNLEKAVLENDVIDLRTEISNIMETQTSYNQEFEDIEKFLENDLSKEQLAEFENDMFENQDLQIDVNLHKEIDSAGAESDIMNLRDNLTNIRKEIDTTEEKSVIKLDSKLKSSVIRYSAAVVILIVFGISLMSKLQPTSNEKLFNDFSIEKNGFISRGIDNDLMFKYGNELFNDKKFEQASLMFGQVLKRDKNNSAAHFYLGSSKQYEGKFTDAINSFDYVVKNNENTLIDLAEYNLGLCYLMREDRKQAVEQFKKVSRNGNYYAPKANAILRKLKVKI